MPTLRELQGDPKFDALSPEAKTIVFDKLAGEDSGFLKMSSEAQGIVRTRLLGPSREQLRETTPFEIETAQFGGEVTPAVPRTPEEVQALKEKASGFVRPTLEGGLGTAGATLGIPAGPVGIVGGGAFGFAAGQQLADMFDEVLGLKPPDSLIVDIMETTRDLGLGGIFEALPLGGIPAVGRALAPVRKKIASWVGSAFPSWSKAAVKDKAAKIFEAIMRNPEDRAAQARKVAEATELEGVFPGLKFRTGEILDDRNLIRLERALTKPGTGLGELRAARQVETAQKAIQSKVRSVFPNQQGLDEVLIEVQRQADELADAATMATEGRGRLLERLTPLDDIQAGGRTVSGALGAEKEAVRAQGGRLFQAVGNPTVPGDDLLTSLRKAKATFFEFGGKEADFPGEINALIDSIAPRPVGATQELLTGVPAKARNITYQKLRGFQKRIGAATSKIKGSLTGRNTTSDALDKAFASIEESGFSQLTGELAEKHSIARNFWANNVGKKFGSGTVGKVLRPGATAASARVGSASVAGEFFGRTAKDLDAADDLIRSVGPGRAKQMMRDFTAMDLMETKSVINRLTGEIDSKGLATWVGDHKAILQKYGLLDEYSDILNVQKVVDEASSHLSVFNKGAASKLLNGDVNLAMARAFDGNKNIAGTMNELIGLMKGNKSGMEGLRTSFADYIERQILDQTDGLIATPVKTSKIITKMIDRFGPAMRTLYRGQPKRLKLLNDIKKAFQVMAREGELSGKVLEQKESLADKLIFAAGPLTTRSLSELQGYRKLTGWLSKMSQEQVNNILLKAAFDPNYAELLLLPKLVPAEKLTPALSSLASRLGLVAFTPEEEEETP